MKGRCLNRLTTEPFLYHSNRKASSFLNWFFLPPRVGFEPTTLRLTAECSTAELSRIISEPSKLHTSTLKNHSLNRALTSSDVQGQVFDRLVTVRSMHHCTSTPALSTSSSSRGLIIKWGYLILEGASRLDAFSVYPFRAWLLCHEPGGPTDTPAARPPRSSRTKGSSPQISYAHAG